MNNTLLLAVTMAILETVVESGEQGSPSGPMYAATMGHGVTLDQYQNVMDSMVRIGLLSRTGHMYYATGKGEELVKKAKVFTSAR